MIGIWRIFLPWARHWCGGVGDRLLLLVIAGQSLSGTAQRGCAGLSGFPGGSWLIGLRLSHAGVGDFHLFLSADNLLPVDLHDFHAADFVSVEADELHLL